MVRPRASQEVRRCSTASRSECVVWLHGRAGVWCATSRRRLCLSYSDPDHNSDSRSRGRLAGPRPVWPEDSEEELIRCEVSCAFA